MTREFRLASLLRIRRTQEEQAGGVLAERTARVRDARALRERATQHLAGYGEPGTELVNLRAIAASRASAHAMLGELRELEAALAADAEAAREHHRAARGRTRRLEKLETAHLVRLRGEDVRREQATLDELAALRRRSAPAEPRKGDGDADR